MPAASRSKGRQKEGAKNPKTVVSNMSAHAVAPLSGQRER